MPLLARYSPLLLLLLPATFLADGCGKKPVEAPAGPSIEQLKAGIENKHPSTYYELASRLFKDGQKDEAVFWYYVGQIRFRFHLRVAKDLNPAGDPALFAGLSEMVGAPLNDYALGDIPKLAATIDKALAWDDAHDNGFTPKKGNETSLSMIRESMQSLKEEILKDQEKIKAQRKANGIE
jgi:hypothetical protein